MSDFFHAHNLSNPQHAGRSRPFGIRASVPASDPITRLLGNDWQREFWYASREERNQALADMQSHHGYYRDGDNATVIYQAVDKED